MFLRRYGRTQGEAGVRSETSVPRALGSFLPRPRRSPQRRRLDREISLACERVFQPLAGSMRLCCNLSDSVVKRVSDIDVPCGINRQPEGKIQRASLGRSLVSAELGKSVSRHPTHDVFVTIPASDQMAV